ncbi:invasion protein expression up-regulator SirB [Vespertiliibacter pulmonis]|uniref:Putative membrane protein SirB2 n=1 Tax=Vespertiliibacter pulmonis TaxID=1443036 RepID=A0A3N4VY37_9PAST|nr:SirB2 family protein [Vespertiliibacter pulmonis]QLB20143.1 invasion protein expression up-regulator SirB [Vespertiliibacter pulmonis]RPE86115.1 putative membrane protein SirB2 [Vespertiliibacter pulmonis]
MNIIYLSHISLAYISLGLLLLRGVLSAKMVDWRQYKILKIAPHIIDTLLLISGITIFFGFSFNWNESWIWSKLLFLVLYIIFAAKAFKKQQPFSLKHFLLAVVSFMLMMLIAVIH